MPTLADTMPASSLPPNERIGYPGLLLANFIPLSLATITVLLRLYMRLFIKAVGGWDDASMLVALILAFGYAGGVAVNVQYGLGRHIYYMELSNFHGYAKLHLAVNILHASALFFARNSIAMFLLRMTKSASNKYRSGAIWAAIVLNIMVAIATIIPFLIICVPLNAFWDKDLKDYWCTDPTTFNDLWRGLTIVNCVIDFMLALIPVFTIHGLQLHGKVKLGAYLLMSCGLVTAACGAGKAAVLDTNTGDESWALVPFYYWAAFEIHLAILFGSFPVVRQFFTHIRNTHSIYPTTIPMLPTSTSSRVLEKHKSSSKFMSGKSGYAGGSSAGGVTSGTGLSSKNRGEKTLDPTSTELGTSTQHSTTGTGTGTGPANESYQPQGTHRLNPLARWKRNNGHANDAEMQSVAEPERPHNDWIKLPESNSSPAGPDGGFGSGRQSRQTGMPPYPGVTALPAAHTQDGAHTHDMHSASRRNLLADQHGNHGASAHPGNEGTSYYRNPSSDDDTVGTAHGGDGERGGEMGTWNIGRRDSISVEYEQPAKGNGRGRESGGSRR